MIATVDKNEDWKISYSEFRVKYVLFNFFEFSGNTSFGISKHIFLTKHSTLGSILINISMKRLGNAFSNYLILIS